jgi:hypothetical protein
MAAFFSQSSKIPRRQKLQIGKPCGLFSSPTPEARRGGLVASQDNRFHIWQLRISILQVLGESPCGNVAAHREPLTATLMLRSHYRQTCTYPYIHSISGT